MNTKAAGLLGVCVILAALILVLGPRWSTTVPAEGGSDARRYQFQPGNANNVFILDTRTGRLWRKYLESQEGPSKWEEESGPWVSGASK
jgi:hypothetical protein